MDGLGAATRQRLAAALGGEDTARRLQVADLQVGLFGVLDVVVDQVHPPRPFQRKRGGQGLLGRVSLSDASGTIDAVLWDDEIRTWRGVLEPGARVRVHGATVKAGYRGGLEMGLTGAVVTALPREKAMVRGRVVFVGMTEVVDALDGPRCKCEVRLATPDGEVLVVAWDEAIKVLREAQGLEVELPASPHPALPGCWIAGQAPP